MPHSQVRVGLLTTQIINGIERFSALLSQRKLGLFSDLALLVMPRCEMNLLNQSTLERSVGEREAKGLAGNFLNFSHVEL